MKSISYIFVCILATIFIFGSCAHSDNPERNKAYDDMMAIHDEVMPEMGTIYKLEKGLKKKIMNTTNPDSLAIMNNTLKRLSESGEGMMDWMHKLDIPGKKVPDTDAIAYFKKETSKISAVSKQMKESISSSKALLGE